MLSDIISQLDAVRSSLESDNYKSLRTEYVLLNNMYKTYVPDQNAIVEPLSNSRINNSVPYTNTQDKKIREILAAFRTAQTQRGLLLDIVNTILNDPTVSNQIDNINDIIDSVQNTEKNLDSKINTGKSILSEFDMPAVPAVYRFDLSNEIVPYGETYSVNVVMGTQSSQKLTNVTADILSNDMAICEEINIGTISPEENIRRTYTFESPTSGEQSITISITADQTDRIVQKSISADSYAKRSFALRGIEVLKRLKSAIDNSSISGEVETGFKSQIEAAISSAQEARSTARDEQKNSGEGEKARANIVNQELQLSIENIKSFETEYAQYQAQYNISSEYDKAIQSYSGTARSHLRKGRTAGLKSSGKTGGTNDSAGQSVCANKKLEASGSRDHGPRIYFAGDTMRVTYYLDEVSNAEEVELYDFVPNEWEFDPDFGSGGKKQNQGNKRYSIKIFNNRENIPFKSSNINDNGVRAQIFFEAPEDINSTIAYTFGPAEVRLPENSDISRTIGESYTVFVIPASTNT